MQVAVGRGGHWYNDRKERSAKRDSPPNIRREAQDVERNRPAQHSVNYIVESQIGRGFQRWV
jgi:hypothetical protein